MTIELSVVIVTGSAKRLPSVSRSSTKAVRDEGFFAVKETVTSSFSLDTPTSRPSGKSSASGACCVSIGSFGSMRRLS